MINQVIHGDCLEVLKTIPDNYFDSLVCDPPGGISFMQSGNKGKTWDSDKGGMLNWINWMSEIMSEAMRTMKPGACGLVWSIPRTSHWTGMALELAGFRLIDVIHVASGQGFPKGQDISSILDKMANAEREVVGRKNPHLDGSKRKVLKGFTGSVDLDYQGINLEDGTIPVTAPTTPEAKQWDGWKTPALKPAVEGWWLVQKPISESSIARNILKHGVGGINIEACRIGTETRFNQQKDFSPVHGNKFGSGVYLPNTELKETTGRYPANLILSCGADCQGDNHSPDCPVSVIGEQNVVSTKNTLCYNKENTSRLKKCCETVNNAELSSTLDRMMSSVVTVNSAHQNVKLKHRKNQKANGTLGDGLISETDVPTDAGESLEVGKYISNLNIDGCGKNTMEISQKDMTSITLIMTEVITNCPTCKASHQNYITITIKDLEKITSSKMMELKLEDVEDADNTTHYQTTAIDPQGHITAIVKIVSENILESSDQTIRTTSATTTTQTKKKSISDVKNSEICQNNPARYFKQLPFDPETVNSIYYQAKASTKDRTSNGTVENTHPTVKSTALMEYFIKLITPPNGIVLDPFGGSGTTGVAAKKTGFNYVLIEKEQEYIDIINQRLTAPVVTPKPTLEERVQWLETQVKAQNNKIKKLEKQQYQQLSLFG